MMEALYDLFRRQTANLTELTVYPVDYQGTFVPPPFFKVEFIPKEISPQYQTDRVEGVIIFQGYFPLGQGQADVFKHYAILQEALGRLTTEGLSISSSGMTPGPSGSSSLSRYDFSFNFIYHGTPT